MLDKIGNVLIKTALGFLLLVAIGGVLGATIMLLAAVWELGRFLVGSGGLGIAALMGILVLCYVLGGIGKENDPWKL